MKAHDAIIQTLQVEGVDTVFSLMSEDTKGLLSKLRSDWDDEIQIVETRHEQNAVAMADGYARTTGDVGVCVIGRGPGIAQTGTSLLTTNRRGSRVLVFVPESPLSTTYDVKKFDQEAFLQTMLGDVVSIDSHETLIPAFEDTFRRLRADEGPIAVQVPWDLLDREIEVDDDVTHLETRERLDTSGSRIHPEEGRIRDAIDLYLDSDATVPPVIIAGRGAVRADAKEPLEQLAERMNAMLATTLQGRGYFSAHPYSVGFVGDFGNSLANEFLSQSDYVLAVGCSLNPHTMDAGRLVREEATIVHVDATPSSIERYTPVDLGIVGDARVTARQLLDELEREEIDFSGKFWTDRRRERIADASPLDDREFPDHPDRMDPREAVRILDRILPEERLVISDGGHFTNWVLDGIEITHPDDFIWTLDFAAVGQGLPVGIGATLAEERRACVAFCGDAGFLMALQEVDTANRLDIPITIVVMNDSALGSEYHQLELIDEYSEAALVDSPDLAEVARGLGAESHTASSASELEDLADVLTSDRERPLVVDCLVNHEVRHRSYDQLFTGSH